MKPEYIWQGTKSFSLLAVLFVIGLFIHNISTEIKTYFKLKNEHSQQELIQLTNNIIATTIQYNTKELEKRIASLDSSVLKLIAFNHQIITEYAKITTTIQGTIKEALADRHIDDIPTKHFDDTLISIPDANGNDFPLARVFYSYNLDDPDVDPWTIQLFDVDFISEIAIGEDTEHGSDAYIKTWMVNRTIEEFRDKKVPLTLKNVEWYKKDLQEKKFSFNTRLSITGTVGMNIYPSIGISLFSYGRTNRDMDWRLLGFNLGGNAENLFIGLQIAEFNIGKYIPLIENVFLGLPITVDNELTYGFGISLAVPI